MAENDPVVQLDEAATDFAVMLISMRRRLVEEGGWSEQGAEAACLNHQAFIVQAGLAQKQEGEQE